MEIPSDIIKGCFNNNRRAQESLYKLLYGRMMGICMRYTKDNEMASEVLNEGFFKILTKIKKYDYKGSFEGWAKRIITNTAIDYYRKNIKDMKIEQLDEVLIEAEETLGNNTDNNVLEQMGAEEIIQYIQLLPDSYRTVFNMYVIDGYAHKEIAEQLNISEGTSKSNLAKARLKLQRIIGIQKKTEKVIVYEK